MPPEGSVGFAPADWALFILTALFLLAVFVWRPRVQAAFNALAQRTRVCMLLLFVLPIALRLLLLPHHPPPTPDVYDEFSHLLLADTLLNGRLANPAHPMHEFFETFFVLQQPTYSSIYPLGLGIEFAIGRFLSGTPWTGVLIVAGALCAACYWMLRGWVSPAWALLGGLLAVMEFGPLCQWTNSYWGGSLAATAGCLVFGALPRLHLQSRHRDAVVLGLGFGVHMITRQFETVFLLLAVAIYLARSPQVLKLWRYALLAVLPFFVLILLQNRAVTHSWTTLPEQLSQYQYGVPTSLTIEASPTPHVPLTPQQETDYRAQSLTHGPGETVTKFLLRLEYRVRYYRFFFLPPLYLALIGFLFALKEKPLRWVALTLAIFALGTNLFPYLLVHYLAAVTCLFILASIAGLRQISRFNAEIAFVLIVLCIGEFMFWYTLHLFETPNVYSLLDYETWDAINHRNPQRRIEVQRQVDAIAGPLLVFVRYSPRHVYQEEWVWNKADIDNSRVVYARDLGAEEDQKLIAYYPKRKVLLLEPDFAMPKLSAY
jgi:hypothetical protein